MITDKVIPIADLGGASELQCPRCKSQCLHHCGVKVFDRGEDHETVMYIEVAGAAVTTRIMPSAGSGNPSSRRDGLAIQFWCEGCSEKEATPIELTIAQHKGSTEIAWRYQPLPKN